MPKINLKSRIVGHREEAPDNLTANPLNFRRHPKEQLNALKGSMKELGWIKTVIVNKRSGYVLDGHARVEEAIRQGLPSIPVTYVDLDENEEKLALAVLDPITELAYRDDETLKLLLEQANASDQDLKDFLLTLNAQEAESGLLPTADEDDVPETPKKAITKLGDLIILGNHRLLCGDATKIENIDKLMSSKKADMVFTDPPYGIRIVKGNTVGGGGKCKPGKYREIIGDDTTETAVNAYNVCVSLEIPVQIFWGGNYYADRLPPSSCWIVWDKDNGKNNFADAELAWTNQKTAVRIFKHRWNGMLKASERNQKRVHPTQKPVALAEWTFENYGNLNDKVLDLFGGSGSTLIACEKTNRHCYMMELDPIYCDVIIERWEKATGKKAIRQ
jgi:ParB-like chromosome segregation protein Spo0J